MILCLIFAPMKKQALTILLFIVLGINAALAGNHVVVLEKDDNIEIKGTFIAKIKFKDKIFTSNCSYQEVIKTLKQQAIEKNANLIKILEHKFPDGWSTCHRITAELYSVENTSIYEKEILWSDDRKLTWEDFKAEHSPYGNIEGIAAATQCGIMFETNRITNFKKPKYFVRTVFFVNKSWVGEKGRVSAEVLLHEQKHFDLCEIYARRLYKELSEANINVYTIEQANAIYKKVFDDYNERQYNYDVETNHSTIAEEQEKWNKIIETELAELAAYADHY